jgi:hypothetical protein
MLPKMPRASGVALCRALASHASIACTHAMADGWLGCGPWPQMYALLAPATAPGGAGNGAVHVRMRVTAPSSQVLRAPAARSTRVRNQCSGAHSQFMSGTYSHARSCDATLYVHAEAVHRRYVPVQCFC